MEEPIDPVALGLKRGPRGAVALVLLIAIPLAVVAVRSVERAPVPVAPPENPPAVASLAPEQPTRPRLKRGAQPQKKTAPAPALREVVTAAPPPPAPVRESAAAPSSNPSPARLVEEDEEPAVEQKTPPPPAPAPEPEPERDGNGEAIARAIAAEKRAAVRACFETELKQSPKLHGTVVVELDLAPPNRVNGVRVSDDLERAAFTSCVAATMRDVRFAALDEEISVSVPYVLTPAAK